MNLNGMMVRSADVLGSALHDARKHKLGTIREIFLDRSTGQAKFVILELSAMFGVGGKFHPIPWGALTFQENTDGYVTTLTKDMLKNSPAYDRAQLADISYGWGEQTERYFSTPSSMG